MYGIYLFYYIGHRYIFSHSDFYLLLILYRQIHRQAVISIPEFRITIQLVELKLGVPLNWIVYRVGYG